MPFKSKISICPSSVPLLNLSPTGLQGVHLPSAGPLSWGAQYGTQTSHSYGGVRVDYIAVLPLILFSLLFLFMFLVVEDLFCASLFH